MNWRDYFDLQNKKKKLFMLVFIILLIINMFSIVRVYTDDSFIESKLNSTCNKIQINYNNLSQNVSLINVSSEEEVNNLTKNNLTIPDSEIDSISINNISSLVEVSIYYLNIFKEKSWFSIEGYDCSSHQEKIGLILMRFNYTPLFIIKHLFIAWLISSLIITIISSTKQEELKKEN